MDVLFGWLYGPIGTMLSWFSSLFGGSYALALLLYALLFKLLFLPFSIKQQKNQIKMARLTPKIELIKAKYRGRNDQPTMQKMQQEIMELQQKEGYSPLSGCLPMLLQLPIIIFLYDIIRNPLTYIAKFDATDIDNIVTKLEALVGGTIDKANQIGLISHISEHKDALTAAGFGDKIDLIPNFKFLGMDLAATPDIMNISWLVAIPVLAAAFTWLSMWLTRRWNGNSAQVAGQDAQSAASMKIMDLVMPLMTLWIAFSFSGMLGLYWIYQSALGILQSFILSRVMPMPRYTEEEIKEMRKAEKAAEKAQRQALKSQPKYRSLHYIDEDDYDELPEVKTQTSTKKTTGGIEPPEIKD